MFKRENRLVPGIKFNNSRLVACSQFVLKQKENGLGVNRYGIVVSKKVDKKAVGRNKIKRFFRNALVNLDKKINAGHDILIVVKKEILNKSSTDSVLDKSKGENLLAVENALEKAGLMGNQKSNIKDQK